MKTAVKVVAATCFALADYSAAGGGAWANDGRAMTAIAMATAV